MKRSINHNISGPAPKTAFAVRARGLRAVLAGLVVLLVLGVLGASGAPAAAREAGIKAVRDAEIEEILGQWSAPLLRQAGMDTGSVRIVLVESPDVNAFVAGGPNIFIHTGLLMKTGDPGEVLGVIAHELGHISGGHLLRTREALRDASWEAMAGTLLGVGAAIASGQGGAAGALSLGSQSMAMRNFMAHSRMQESSADQAALRVMTRAGYDPSGLVTFLEKIGGGDLAAQTGEVEYVRTHPLTGNRIDALRGGVEGSATQGKGWTPAMREAHARMKAKLVGFLAPDQVSWHFADQDASPAAEYARAIAAYRRSRTDEAVRRIDALIGRAPDNPYFHEIKGQMLLEFGRAGEAVQSYGKAVALRPHSGLLRIDLARALIAQDAGAPDAKTRAEALSHLHRALHAEPRSALAHRLLATLYGQAGEEPMAQLHLAEEALLQRRVAEARRLAEAALKGLPTGQAPARQARDILAAADRIGKERAGADD